MKPLLSETTEKGLFLIFLCPQTRVFSGVDF